MAWWIQFNPPLLGAKWPAAVPLESWKQTKGLPAAVLHGCAQISLQSSICSDNNDDDDDDDKWLLIALYLTPVCMHPIRLPFPALLHCKTGTWRALITFQILSWCLLVFPGLFQVFYSIKRIYGCSNIIQKGFIMNNLQQLACSGLIWVAGSWNVICPATRHFDEHTLICAGEINLIFSKTPT